MRAASPFARSRRHWTPAALLIQGFTPAQRTHAASGASTAECLLTAPLSVQTPRREERAAINRPKVTLLCAPAQNDTLSQKLSAGLFPAPSLQASTLLAAQQYLAQYAQQMPTTSVPGEAFALLGMQRLGSSSVMLEAAGLYLESALVPVRNTPAGARLQGRSRGAVFLRNLHCASTQEACGVQRSPAP